jgi:IQ and ubiquitin-like domain-containing protein
LSFISGLRKRINSLFLQFIRTPEFNPEAQSHQKAANASLPGLKGGPAVYYCCGCQNYKPSTEFYMSTTMKHLGKCKECTNQKNVAIERTGETVYNDMLKLIRIQEGLKRRTPHQAIYNAMSLLQGEMFNARQRYAVLD